MLFILPIGQAETKFRRAPAVTIAVLAINVLVFIYTYVPDGTLTNPKFDQAFSEAVEFYSRNPDLDLDPELRSMLNENALEMYERFGELVEFERGDDRDRQEKLDALCNEALTHFRSSDLYRFGFVAARPKLKNLLTHMWVHAGWMHLLGNMLFLYISAPLLEDVLGRPTFAVLYFLGGLAAASPGLIGLGATNASGVGASGAIAAVMGAFLVRFAQVKIRFVYFIWAIKVFYGTFWLPAFLVLPAWLVSQFASLGSPTGVAYWAHIGGFLFGFAVMAGLRWGGVEKRFIAPKLDEALGIVRPPGLEEGRDARRAGRTKSAKGHLLRAVKAVPNSPEAHHELALTLLELGDADNAATHASRAIDLWIRKHKMKEATGALDDFSSELPALKLSVATLLTLARHAERRGEEAEAVQLYERAASENALDPAVAKGLSAAADIQLRHGGHAAAVELLRRALYVPRVDADVARDFERRLRDIAEEGRLPVPDIPRRQTAGAAPPVIASDVLGPGANSPVCSSDSSSPAAPPLIAAPPKAASPQPKQKR